MTKYYVYILQSVTDESYYIGHTSDLDRRLEFHNKGTSKYTSTKLPWKLVYYEILNSKSDAIRREKFLKRQKNTKFYKTLVDNFKKL